MAQRARRFAEEQQDWEIVSRKMEIVMQKVAQEAASRRREQEFATA
jgi:hypothetical protein